MISIKIKDEFKQLTPEKISSIPGNETYKKFRDPSNVPFLVGYLAYILYGIKVGDYVKFYRNYTPEEECAFSQRSIEFRVPLKVINIRYYYDDFIVETTEGRLLLDALKKVEKNE